MLLSFCTEAGASTICIEVTISAKIRIQTNFLKFLIYLYFNHVCFQETLSYCIVCSKKDNYLKIVKKPVIITHIEYKNCKNVLINKGIRREGWGNVVPSYQIKLTPKI